MSSGLAIKPSGSCKYDLVSLGEVMLRLNPGEPRVKGARRFDVWEGSGDSFASGFIFDLMTTADPQQPVEYGASHGALAMTTPGDASVASRAEVEKRMASGSARLVR